MAATSRDLDTGPREDGIVWVADTPIAVYGIVVADAAEVKSVLSLAVE